MRALTGMKESGSRCSDRKWWTYEHVARVFITTDHTVTSQVQTRSFKPDSHQKSGSVEDHRGFNCIIKCNVWYTLASLAPLAIFATRLGQTGWCPTRRVCYAGKDALGSCFAFLRSFLLLCCFKLATCANCCWSLCTFLVMMTTWTV